MPLSSESESVLESAMKRITGEPGTGGGGGIRPAQFIPENIISYGGEFTDRQRLGTSAAPSGTVNVASTPAPAAATPTAAAAAPSSGLTYAQQLRNDLAFSGITGGAADQVINQSLAAGSWNLGTAYDPKNTLMNINPGIAPGTAQVTRSGPYDPLSVTTIKAPKK